MKPCSSFEPPTLVDLLRWRALHQPDQLAYTFLLDGETEEVHLTYGDLDRRARAIAVMLQSLGAYGDRALLVYPPGLEFVAAFFGCLYAGVIAIPVYPPHSPRLERSLPKFRAIAHDAQPVVVLTSSAFLSLAENVPRQAPGLQVLRWLTTDTIDSSIAENWQPPVLVSSSLAFFQYTSGSTATPKGVMLSHRNVLHNLVLIEHSFEYTAEDRGVIWLPPYHDMGLIGGVIQPLYAGVPVTLMSPISFIQAPRRWLQVISRTRATISGGPAFAYDLCVSKITLEQRATIDLSSWDVAFTGAEQVHHETLERFIEAFRPCGFRKEAFYSGYGLAEATLFVSGGLKAAPPVVFTAKSAALEHNRVVAGCEGEDGAQTFVGCGKSLGNQKIDIVHPEILTRCSFDEVGEIWVSGQSVAQGYWNRPEETEHSFKAYLADTGEGPFLRTGDLGFLKDGELFVTGRLKDLIIIDGYNYYPQDIELTVERSHPSIRPNCCAAFSVVVGEKERLIVMAEVERHYLPKRDQSPDAVATLNEASGARINSFEGVAQAIKRTVAESHELRVYAVSLLKPGSIPKTSSGKIQRHVCRINFLTGNLDAIKG